MKGILEVFKNVKGGPRTTIIGALLMAFGGFLIYNTETTFTWVSVEVGIFILGTYLCIINDDGTT
jgi:fucose permease